MYIYIISIYIHTHIHIHTCRHINKHIHVSMYIYSALCHSCGFACQQRVLKTFPGPGYLLCEDGVV